MEQDIMHSMERIGSLMPIAEAFLRGFCFFGLAKPFVKKKESAFCGGAAYFLVTLLFYVTRLTWDAYMIYGTASLCMFLTVCLLDRRNYRQKLFLAAAFFSFSWFAAGMAEILYDNLYDFFLQTTYVQSHPGISVPLWLIMCAGELAFEILFIAVGIWQILRVYENKHAEMNRQELAILALPPAMGVAGYEIMRYYRLFYALETGRMDKAYDALMFLFCGMAMVTVLTVIVLYQKLKAGQEEYLQTKLLASQADNIRRHIEQVEGLYQNIRGIRHDMTNHLLTLERLYAGNRTEEARTYSEDLKAELAQMSTEVRSGNPVTDVILQEWEAEAAGKGISFRSEFYYPADTKIHALDISVILNNALQNAIEHVGDAETRSISIRSFRRRNAYMIEVRNRFDGELQWDAQTGLPLTSKEEPEGHGFGLSNIRRVAKKYAGDIDITAKDGEFCLSILLMAE